MSFGKEQLTEVLEEAAQLAFTGDLPDSMRVRLQELALAVAAEELHRIESAGAGVVAQEALIFMQNIGVLCGPDPTPDKLFQGLLLNVED